MRCKIFRGSYVDAVQQELNKWLEENKPVIYDVVQSESEGRLTITILYIDREVT